MKQSSPARLYSGIAGAVLVVAGMIGFFYSADFGSPGEVERVFGVLDVNGWQNLLHILTGAVGLGAFSVGPRAARRCALALGGAYLVASIWGFAVGAGDSILGIVAVDTEGNVLHLLLGLTGIAAAVASAGTDEVRSAVLE